jgi:hypothetical protein
LGSACRQALHLGQRLFKDRIVDRVILSILDRSGVTVGWSISSIFKGRYYDPEHHVLYSERSFYVEILDAPYPILKDIAEQLRHTFRQQEVIVKSYDTGEAEHVRAPRCNGVRALAPIGMSICWLGRTMEITHRLPAASVCGRPQYPLCHFISWVLASSPARSGKPLRQAATSGKTREPPWHAEPAKHGKTRQASGTTTRQRTATSRTRRQRRAPTFPTAGRHARQHPATPCQARHQAATGSPSPSSHWLATHSACTHWP